MPVRQVQAHEAPRRDLRQVRRRSHAQQSSPRAPRPHRAGFALLARLVLQGPAEPHRLPARYLHARSRAHSLLRSLRGHRYRARFPASRKGNSAGGKIPRTAEGIRRQFDARMGAEAIKELAAPRGRRKAQRRTARKNEDRSEPAEAHQVRQAPEGARIVPQERQQARVDDSGRDSGSSAGVASSWCLWMAAASPRPI